MLFEGVLRPQVIEKRRYRKWKVESSNVGGLGAFHVFVYGVVRGAGCYPAIFEKH